MPLYSVPSDSFGARLSKVRELRGMSQTMLAKEVGVVPSYISQWEAAKALPRPPMIARLESVLQCMFRCDDAGSWRVYYPPNPSALIPLEV